jgi:hypothetical protein
MAGCPSQHPNFNCQYDPVKIHHWVRNHIEWIPTWGAVQNAELTLSAKRGNAMDIASLTLALLRASGIPSRYVHGTIELPTARFNNWAGGFEDSFAAADYAASGGIPVGTVESGGQVSHIQIEHIWVEAAIDYHPSRGAINLAADSWVAMDPSYKQYEYLQGLDVVAISGIDAEQLAQDTAATGTINETEGWVSGLDPSGLTAAQAQAQSALESYITDHLTDPTVGDVIGGRKTIVEEYPILPSALPNHIVTEGVRYATLPAGLQQRVSYTLANASDSVALALADPITLPWSRINNEQLTLSFKPATAADEQALQAMLPEGEITDISQLPASLPTYISVIPELKLNGETILTTDPVGLGQPVAFKTRISYPGRSKTNQNRYDFPAGSYLSVQAIGQVVSPEKLQALQARLEQTKAILESQDSVQIAALTRGKLLGDIFYGGTLSYFTQLTVMGHIAALSLSAKASLSAGYGTLGYEPKVNYFFGLPTSVSIGGIALDIPWSMVSSVSDGDIEKRKQFNLQWGTLASVLEHAVPEQMFQSQDPNDPKPNAISAVKALQIASVKGQRIYQITQANMDTALPNIHHDGKGEIAAALQAGMTVTTHTDSISVPGWAGAGYIILDPEDNTGAYKISGGTNGGAFWAGLALGVAIASIAMLVVLGSPIALALLPLLTFMLMFAYVLQYIMYVLDGKGDSKCWGLGIVVGGSLAGLIFAFGEVLFASIAQAAYRAAINFATLLFGEIAVGSFQGTFSDINECLDK